MGGTVKSAIKMKIVTGAADVIAFTVKANNHCLLLLCAII